MIIYKLDRIITYCDGLLSIKSRDPGRSHDKLKSLISPTIVPMVTKFGRIGTYLEGFSTTFQTVM